MNRTWLLFERILAIVQLLLCLLAAFTMYSYIMTDEETGITQPISNFSFSHYDLVEYRTMYSVIILLLAGSLFLLFSKTAGWIISIVVWLFWLIWLIVVDYHATHTFYYGDYPETNSWLRALPPIICLGVIVFLMQKYFLIKYSVSKWYSVIVLVAVILLLADYNWHDAIGIGWRTLF